MKNILILLGLMLIGCSSAHLVSNWKNPDIVLFDARKILIVGMTQNDEARDIFESKLQKEFSKRGVESMRSIDLFDVEFTSSSRSEEEITEVEQQLLDKDFDAILFTKIVGSENRRTFRKKMNDLNGMYDLFRNDYLRNQEIYYNADYYDMYTVYHAETSLYCICVGKERQLIWTGGIDITDPMDIKTTVNDYIKLVVLALEEQDLIFRKERKDEITGL